MNKLNSLWHCLLIFAVTASHCGCFGETGKKNLDEDDMPVVQSEVFYSLFPNLNWVEGKKFRLIRIETKASSSFPPSPSDTKVTVIARVTLLDDSSSSVLNQGDWVSLNSDEALTEVKEYLSGERLSTNAKINLSFKNNPLLTHGILYKLDTRNEIFIFATDIDHGF